MVCWSLLWSAGTGWLSLNLLWLKEGSRQPRSPTSVLQTAGPVLLGHLEKEKMRWGRGYWQSPWHQLNPPHITSMPKAPVSYVRSASRVLCSAPHGRRIWTDRRVEKWEVIRVRSPEPFEGRLEGTREETEIAVTCKWVTCSVCSMQSQEKGLESIGGDIQSTKLGFVSERTTKRKEQRGRHHASWFQTLLQSYSNQRSMVLA